MPLCLHIAKIDRNVDSKSNQRYFDCHARHQTKGRAPSREEKMLTVLTYLLTTGTQDRLGYS